MTWGAIFDFDGVVIDSAAYHEKSWDILAEEEGRTLPPNHFKQGFGQKNATIIPKILKWGDDPNEIERISKRKEEIYREIIKCQGIEALPGVEGWLIELYKAGIPCVIGTSAERKNIDTIVGILGFNDYFKGWVTSEDVSLGKPDPEVFLKCANKLNITPNHCVVFEDALVGIQAAKAGGMMAVGVATTHPKEELTGADIVVDRLDELSADRFMNLCV